MPAALISKHEVLDRLTAAFRAHGYEGTTLARLSKATGLVRASLYHYFPGGKEEMARAVLAHAGERLEALVLAPLEAEDAPPAECLARMVEGLDAFYSGGAQACLLGLLSVGDAGPLFAQEVRTALDRWIGLLARVLAEAGLERRVAHRRAEDAVGAVQGALVMARAYGVKTPFARLIKDLPDRLLAGASLS